mgnify:FL=1
MRLPLSPRLLPEYRCLFRKILVIVNMVFLRAHSICLFSIKHKTFGRGNALLQEGLEGKAAGFLRAERAMKPRKARRQLVAGLPVFLNCFLTLRML